MHFSMGLLIPQKDSDQREPRPCPETLKSCLPLSNAPGFQALHSVSLEVFLVPVCLICRTGKETQGPRKAKQSSNHSATHPEPGKTLLFLSVCGFCWGGAYKISVYPSLLGLALNLRVIVLPQPPA